MPNVRTDLAMEAHEALGKVDIPGVRVEEEVPSGDIRISRVEITGEEGARRLGKPIGRYVTVESRRLREHDPEHAQKVGEAVSRELAGFLGPGDDPVLVVGLGNWNATPDALGPKVIERVLVTRHLKKTLQAEVGTGLRTVSAVAPGVLGLTGIESLEMVEGLSRQVEPRLVLAIDALAAAHVERIGATIQISDTGIHPGSGVGNRRGGLTFETLGRRVIAIGVPTVVHAMTVAKEALRTLAERLGGDVSWQDIERSLGGDYDDARFEEVLGPELGALVVTPKEIDIMIHDLTRIMAGAINTALHPDIDLGEFALFS